MSNWIDVAEAGTLEDGDAMTVEAEGRRFAVYRVGDEIFATDGVCSHAFALLGDGWLEDYEIECPLHAAKFCIRTGKALTPPAEEDIAAYPARIENGKVQVQVDS